MRAVRLGLLLPLVLVCGSEGVAPPPRPAKSSASMPGQPVKVAALPPSFEARLEDESLIRLTLLQSHVRITTPYGKLQVPAHDIHHIDFRPRPGDAIEKRIKAAAELLGQKDLASRLAGRKELLALAPASYSTVLRLARSGDLEIVMQAKQVQEQIESRYSEDHLRRKPHDEIVTPTFPIAGQIDDASLKVQTRYFGEAQLALGAIRSLRSLGRAGEATVVLDAKRYAGQDRDRWLETNVMVRAGARLRVKATGEINMWPEGGNSTAYLSRPGGATWAGPAVQGAQRPGTVLGRIGKTGKVLILGESYEAAATEEGLLYLRIEPNNWGGGSAGEYRVTIKTW